MRLQEIKGDVYVPSCVYKLDYTSFVVKGDFSCTHTAITSLEGAPSRVDGGFYCGYNNIISLHNVHKIIKYIGGDFYISSLTISNIMGIMFIKGVKQLVFVPRDPRRPEQDLVENIINKHLKGDHNIHVCQEELLEAGLVEYARL